jgi:dephospho-CoA kinase
VNNFTLEGKMAVLLDAAAIFESKIDKLCTFTVVVTALEDVRKERIIKRDVITAEKAEERIKAQLSENEYEQKADVIIRNHLPYDIETETEKLIEAYKERKQ